MATVKSASNKAAPKKAAAKKAPAKKTAVKKWSALVTEHSDALDLENKVFTSKDPKKIARSLKKSAEESDKKKTTTFQSAMSMLNFYINRAGKNFTAEEKKPLEDAKEELRKLFGKDEKE